LVDFAKALGQIIGKSAHEDINCNLFNMVTGLSKLARTLH